VPFRSYWGYKPGEAWRDNTYLKNLNTKVTKLHLLMKLLQEGARGGVVECRGFKIR
jgi:hypothetical protein